MPESPEIAALAETVRRGLDADLRVAVGARQRVGREWELLLDERGDGMVFNDDGDLIVMVDRESTVADLLRGVLFAEVGEHMVRQDPERTYAEVRAKRTLLDEALGWGHEAVEGRYRYHPCEASADPPGYCDCGRDTRVRAVLTALAAPYQETT
jgi:hypothetical protein